MQAQQIDTAQFDKQRMEQSIDVFRQLTFDGPAALFDDLVKVAAEFGIAVVFVPHLPKTYVCGAAYWHGETPVIQLSFRGKMFDILWFNFFKNLGTSFFIPKKKHGWMIFLKIRKPMSSKPTPLLPTR